MTAQTSVSLRLHEQIYTSADRLLESSSGHLGVVASTLSFPQEVSAHLQPLRSYTLLPDLSIDDASQHPPRLIVGLLGGREDWYCMTQVSFAGADHTGRTTPLAHHIAIAKAELVASQTGPASILLGGSLQFRSSWRDTPQWIDAPRSLADNSPATPFDIAALFGLSEIETHQFLAGAADVLLDFSLSHRPLVLAVSRSQADHAAQIFATVLARLPLDVQLATTCCSHVVERTDLPRESSFALTYPDTSFWEHVCRREDKRRPIVCELGQAQGEVFERSGPYAQAIRKESLDRDLVAESMVPKLWDELHLSPAQAIVLPLAMQTRLHLDDLRKAKDVPEVTADLSELRLQRPEETAVGIIQGWISATIHRVVESEGSDAWLMFCRIIADQEWPDEAKRLAQQQLADNAERAIPCLLDNDDFEHVSAADIDRTLATLTVQRPDLVTRVIHRAVKKPSPRSQRWAEKILQLAGMDAKYFIELAFAVAKADQQTREALFSIIRFRLIAMKINFGELETAARACSQHGKLGIIVARDLIGALVQERMPVSQEDTEWQPFADILIRTSAILGSLPQTLAQLTNNHKNSISSECAAKWRRIAEELDASAEFDACMRRHAAERIDPPKPEMSIASDVVLPRVSSRSVATNRAIGRPVRGGWLAVGPVMTTRVTAALTILAATALVAITWKPNSLFDAAPAVAIAASAVVFTWGLVESVIQWRVRNALALRSLPIIRWGFLFAILVALSLVVYLIVINGNEYVASISQWLKGLAPGD